MIKVSNLKGMIMTNALKYVAAILLFFGLGYAAARYTLPVKTITVEKEVVKTIVNTVTKTRTVTSPDGTTTTETETTDKSKTITESDKSQVIENDKAKYKVSLQGGYNFDAGRQVYGLTAEKRFAGPVFIGAWGNTDKAYGLSIGMEF